MKDVLPIVRNYKYGAVRYSPKRPPLKCAIVMAAILESSQPSYAGDLIPPKIDMVTPGGVNLSNAAFTFTNTDLSIGTLSLERFYSGSPKELRDPDTMFYGGHHSNNFDIFVTPVFTNAFNSIYARPQVHIGAASSGMFRQSIFTGNVAQFDSDSTDAQRGILGLVNSAYQYIDSTGAIYLFNPSVQVAGVQGVGAFYGQYSQRIASITYPNGRVRNFNYVGGQLKLVSDTSGYAIVFDYGANGLASAACGFNLSQIYVTTATTCAGAALKVTYGYTGTELTSFVDALGNTTTYTYVDSTDPLITCIKPPGYSSCKIGNVFGGAATITQTFADGSVWQISSSSPLSGTDTDQAYPGDQNVFASVTDPNGKQASYRFTGTSPYSMTDANGHTTNYRFTGGKTVEQFDETDAFFGAILQSVTLPEGNVYTPINNGPYLAPTKETWTAKPGSGLADVVVQYGYTSGTPAQIVHPIWIKDANGNQTDYTYATHGGQLSEMKPAPTTGAPRPLKLTTWVQKFAYIKNSAGTLVAAASPIWTMASETECQTAAGSSATVCDNAAPKKITSYEYGADGTANNLNVRGVVVSDGTTSRRTCYAYDNNGNRISQTTPRAGLSVCP